MSHETHAAGESFIYGHDAMTPRLTFLPGPIAAALSSVVLAIFAGIYLPYTSVICDFGGSPGKPDVATGEAWFSTPETVIVTLQADGTLAVADQRVRGAQLRALLEQTRARHPHRPLEIEADRRVATFEVLAIIAAARDAGYREAFVFGQQHSLLELASP